MDKKQECTHRPPQIGDDEVGGAAVLDGGERVTVLVYLHTPQGNGFGDNNNLDYLKLRLPNGRTCWTDSMGDAWPLFDADVTP